MASLFNRPFPDWLTRLLVPVLAGIAVGAVTGAFVYPRLVMSFGPTVNERLASFDPPAKEQARGKIEAALSVRGARFGAWIGTSAGVVFGAAAFAIAILNRKPA